MATEPWKDMEESKVYISKWKKSIWKAYCMILIKWHSGKGKTM